MIHSYRGGGLRYRQRGIALITAAALSALLGVAAYASYVGIAAIRASQLREAQDDLLVKADAALTAYVAVKGHLPCPASGRGGDENCTADDGAPRQKGWIPKSVADQFAAIGDAAEMLNLRYLVYRGSDSAYPDLAGKQLTFPTTPDYAQIQNGFDYCYNLATISAGLGGVNGGLPSEGRSVEARDAYANVPTDRPLAAGSKVINVAYGIAAPGTNGFSGANADNLPHLESPSREQLSTYSERVHIADMREAARKQSCAASNNSMLMLVLADEWTKSVPSDRESATKSFVEQTIVPLTGSMAYLTMYAVFKVQTLITDNAQILAGMTAATARNLALCTAGWIPACAAATAQGVAEGGAAAAATAHARELVVTTARLAVVIAKLAEAEIRRKKYVSLPIWTEGELVLSAADKVGTAIPKAYP